MVFCSSAIQISEKGKENVCRAPSPLPRCYWPSLLESGFTAGIKAIKWFLLLCICLVCDFLNSSAHRIPVWLLKEQNLPWDRKSYTGGAFLKLDSTKEQICFEFGVGIACVFRRLFADCLLCWCYTWELILSLSFPIYSCQGPRCQMHQKLTSPGSSTSPGEMVTPAYKRWAFISAV